jgi:hypothetical protein
VAGAVVHRQSFQVPSNRVTISHIWCPNGETALSGGYETGDGSSSDTAYATIDAPLSDYTGFPAEEGARPIGWKVYIQNPGTATVGQLFVVCAG